jgi:hypothetical protein
VLGYLTLFLHLAAFYLDGPLLHTLGFQGSTSALWVPKSFWDADLPSEAARHRLHVHAGTGSAAAPPSVPPYAHPPLTLMLFRRICSTSDLILLLLPQLWPRSVASAALVTSFCCISGAQVY